MEQYQVTGSPGSPGTPRRRTWKGRPGARRVGLCAALAASAMIAVPATGSIGSANAAGVINPGVLLAAAPLPTATQFDVTGFIQSASVDVPGDAHSGGSITVNGQVIVIPRETVVILPANALTWQELFAQAPAPYTGVATGMAMNDVPTPLTTYEVNVIGNRVVQGGHDNYIAGLVHISQNDLNNGAGYINFIDYNVSHDGGVTHVAELRIGGTVNDPLCVAAAPPAFNTVAGGATCSGNRVEINDPANPTALDELGAPGSGRYGRAQSPDTRFMVDQDNPTIAAATGYPMCIPRVLVDPAFTTGAGVFPNPDDPQCPRTNRLFKISVPNGARSSMLDPTTPGGFAISTNSGAGTATVPGYVADATVQTPMEVGDYVTFSGTLMNDNPLKPTTNLATAGVTGTYVSAHTIINNFAAYTLPGVNPAYVSIEVALVGTGGLTVFGAGEAAIRTRFEGMTTDPTRNVHVYAIDINPVTGALNDRDWGMVTPDPGPPGGAVEGRWRLRPPCTGTTPTDKVCVGPFGSSYLPPTRELRAVVDGGVGSTVSPNTAPPLNSQTPGFVAPISATSPTSANGLVAGQYHAPIGEYIFPENTPGNPIVANNFETMNFLAYGGYTSGGGTKVGQLNPWPGAAAPVSPTCTTATTGGPYSVPAGGTVTLAGNVGVGATTPVSVLWSASAGSFTNATTTTPTFSAAGLAVGTIVNVSFTASNVCGPSTAPPTTITVTAGAPTLNAIASQTVNSGTPVTLQASSPSAGPLTFQFTQTSGTAVVLPNGGTVSNVTSGANATLTFTAPSGSTVMGFSVTATNATGTSAPRTFTVTVNGSTPIYVVMTGAEYRTGKGRLILAATYSGPDFAATGANAAVLRLQPYMTVSGTMFDPTTLGNVFVPAGGGLYNITLVGAPRPACANPSGVYVDPCTAKPLVVQAYTAAGVLEGTSAPTALLRIRA
jgi:hypothetical protein